MRRNTLRYCVLRGLQLTDTQISSVGKLIRGSDQWNDFLGRSAIDKRNHEISSLDPHRKASAEIVRSAAQATGQHGHPLTTASHRQSLA